MNRRENMCFEIVPLYIGERGIGSRGEPNKSKDYIFRCYHSASKTDCGYRQESTIEALCEGCKKYNHVKPLSRDEIREKFYSGKSKEVLVVSSTGWHFKEI